MAMLQTMDVCHLVASSSSYSVAAAAVERQYGIRVKHCMQLDRGKIVMCYVYDVIFYHPCSLEIHSNEQLGVGNYRCIVFVCRTSFSWIFAGWWLFEAMRLSAGKSDAKIRVNRANC
jgi:hypothetical protein